MKRPSIAIQHSLPIVSTWIPFNAKAITYHDTDTNSRTHKFTCKLRSLVVGFQPLPSDLDDILLVAFTIPHIWRLFQTHGGAGIRSGGL